MDFSKSKEGEWQLTDRRIGASMDVYPCGDTLERIAPTRAGIQALTLLVAYHCLRYLMRWQGSLWHLIERFPWRLLPSALLTAPGRMFSGTEVVAKLRLAYVASSTEWRFAASPDVASLTIGEPWRIKLCEATIALSSGEEDFRIGPEDREQGLWFWRWRP